MSIEKLISDLVSKKGYISNGKLKKGKIWLAQHYGVEVADIIRAVESIRDGKIQNKQPQKAVAAAVAVRTVAPKVISDTPKVYWVAGCLHFPFHNKLQLEKTINYLKSIKVDGIILAGDILDINSLSFHDKGKMPIEGVTLEWEYKESLKAFNQIFSLVDYHNIKDLHFMYGNHEDRYLRTLRQVDNHKLGKALIAPEDYLGLEAKGFKIYKDFQRDFIELGDLVINHGEYLNQHVAKKTIEVYKQSSLFFHTHRFQIYGDGKFVGYNMGWGGDASSPVFNYAPRGMKSAWINSSALVTVIGENSYVQPLMFTNGKLIVNGQEY